MSEKICFFAFFGIPIPLSFNDRMALRFVAFKSRLISPWGIVYLQALERRLSSNISIRCLSAETKTDSSGWVRFSVNCFFSQKDRKTETSFSKTSFRQSGTDEEDCLWASTFSNSSNCVMSEWSLRVLSWARFR